VSTSLLYHGFGIEKVCYEWTEYRDGQTIFHGRLRRKHHRCPVCRATNFEFYGSKTRLIRLVSIGAKPCFLALSCHRIHCFRCGSIRWPHLPFVWGQTNLSKAFVRFALELCLLMTIQSVAKLLKVGWDCIKHLHKCFLAKKYQKISLREVRYVGIDEFAIRKGQRYMTIALDLETGQILFAREGKSAETITPFLLELRCRAHNLKAVAIDMSRGFIFALKDILPNIPVIFDRFHIFKLFNEAMNEFRRRYHQEVESWRKISLKSSRFLLLANPQNLSPPKLVKLREVLELNQPLNEFYLFKMQFLELWNLPDRKSAEDYLEEWAKQAWGTKNAVLHRITNTIMMYRSSILNWFDHPISTAKVEGTNNKIKTLKRSAYGFRDNEYFKLRLFGLHLATYSLTG
jgi:transposase